MHWAGWDKSYRSIEHASRIHPSGTYVLKTKAWLKIGKTIGSWPCILYIRLPKSNDPFGRKNLKYTSQMYVEPIMPQVVSPSLRPHKAGTWAQISDIRQISKGEEYKMRNKLSGKGSIRNDFAESLRLMDASDVPTREFNLVDKGSLCISITENDITEILDSGDPIDDAILPMSSEESFEEEDSNDEQSPLKRKRADDAASAVSNEPHNYNKNPASKIGKSIIQAVCRDMARSEENKEGPLWNIQDHFEFYFSTLKQQQCLAVNVDNKGGNNK